MSVWHIIFHACTLIASIVIPCCLFLYENTESFLYPFDLWDFLYQTFIHKCSKFSSFCILLLCVCGILAIFTGIYYFLERQGSSEISVIYALPGLSILLSWIIVLANTPYGLVALPVSFLRYATDFVFYKTFCEKSKEERGSSVPEENRRS